MFQTELNLWLQQADAPWLVGLMQFITRLGKDEFYQLGLLVVLSGFSYQRGLWVAQTLIATSVLTDWCKEALMLPRPYQIDDRVRSMGRDASEVYLHAAGARGFWQALPADTVAHMRAIGELSWGLPSSHVSTAVAFWGSLIWQFRARLLLLLGLGVIALMPLSRLYLGRHFLADVLAAMLLGAVVLGLLLGLIKPWLQTQLELKNQREQAPRLSRLHWQMALLLPLLLWAVFGSIESAGMLLGLQLAGLCCQYWRWPTERGSGRQRLLRVLITLTIFAGAHAAIKSSGGAPVTVLAGFLFQALKTAVLFGLSFAICQRFRLFGNDG